ncbi:mitochondrial 2-oxodicarboxylate carrier [Neodiprion virginianus]|uniref:Mitochondrial 2-oxodicarboxylate carrier n=1 Tax=Neodiprion lecontei TaxID=441921 RepID=A0A6J0CC81_NEOLC|nr:mitochondrial 2-oxodicarboxylate carrier [Neodiprion lecontei]XP_015523780.1 mitochondrial 2-oxodicarboxylate carrier [Neodiprion lecontei]XP_015523781.1 mitochondrial 2-oxodicarboxylate carrier [Neodiprion lecontei]XP_015523782.1 mitochondrial 2-oxodicarboxylate carrier [Neodiprion lecontei]XP_015523783.1 mitochondrial 2-oxodicarboxylate carrier [Neodiprion lecontei]XP_046599118.1 mitochondrial 2-oxodicarboxylate carrier [Neodiprion lecontei]XP_046599119.1 mitochondrial 2-oxodicarboxylate
MVQQREGPGLLKQAAIQIGAGGSAGFVEVCIMHPMDLVKTRFQLQVKPTAADPTYYTGIVDCMKKMYVSEGFGAYWKGIIPPIIVETPKRAVKFFTFEQYKQFFLFGASSPTPLTFSCAGFFAGVTEGALVNPFEVIKVQLQSNRKKMKESPSTILVTKEIIRTKGLGLNGLYKGLSATVLRNAVFNSVYFGFYHSVKSYIPLNNDPWLEFFTKVGIGFTSGTLASCLNIPFDVAKSRIQGPQPQPDRVKYKGTFRTIAIVYREEGFRALYKGLLPKVVRLGPGGAIMLVVYDYMHHFLTHKFAN